MPVRQRVGEIIGDVSAVLCQRDRRLQQIRERELARAVFIECDGETRDGGGHADAERGVARFRNIGLAVGAQKNLRRVAAGAVSR